MPEGDTVWLAAQRLRDALAGRELTESDFRVPALATVDLAGVRVNDVVPRGKHLLFRLDDGRTLHTHFRMDGSWHLYRPGGDLARRAGPRHPGRSCGPASGRPSATACRSSTCWPPPTSDAVVGHLGPDILGPDWDPVEAARQDRVEPRRPRSARPCWTSATSPASA